MKTKRPKLSNPPVSILGGVPSVTPTATVIDSTPPRKDTGVFESLGRFIGIRCLNYALYMYIYILRKHEYKA